MTDWGQHWELWRLRLPVALYTLATAALVLLTVVSLIYYGIVEYLPQFVEPEKPKK